MDLRAIAAAIERVIQEMVHDQYTVDHLKRGHVEDTIATEFANRLRKTFETDTITVDPHYNKHGNATKRIGKRVIALDIAIHERGVDDNNLVAIELETTNRPVRDDIWKLEALTQPLGAYGYKLGLFLVLGVEKSAGTVVALEWYVDSRRVSVADLG
jgi:hypothetical protein